MRRLLRHTRPLAGALVVSACLALGACKDQNAQQGGGQTAVNTAAQQAAAAKFDKPLHATGPVQLRIITNGRSPFWDPMQIGMTEMAKELPDCEARWTAPEKTDNNAQKQTFENAVAGGANGIAVSPIQADAFAPVIDKAVDQGIPVITFDSDAPTSKRLAYIGTNNYEAGKRAGEEAIKLFPNGGKFVAFVGNLSAQNARDRYQGFLDAVKGHNIEMLQDPFTDDKDAAKARSNVADAITKYGNKINGFLGLYSYNGPAIVDAVQKAGIRNQVKIVCFDGEPRTLDALASGLVDVSIIQKPYQFGRLATQLLYLTNRKGFKAAMDEMKPDLDKLGMKVNGNVIDTGVEIVTPANAKEFIDKLHAKGLSST